MFDTASIDIPCPGCGHKTAQKFGWLKTHDQFTCAGCGNTVTVETEQFRSALKRVDKAIADLTRHFGKFRK